MEVLDNGRQAPWLHQFFQCEHDRRTHRSGNNCNYFNYKILQRTSVKQIKYNIFFYLPNGRGAEHKRHRNFTHKQSRIHSSRIPEFRSVPILVNRRQSRRPPSAPIKHNYHCVKYFIIVSILVEMRQIKIRFEWTIACHWNNFSIVN